MYWYLTFSSAVFSFIMIGHTGQCDLPDPRKSGFAPYIELFRDKHYAKVCELTVNFRGELATDADSINE
ncbi:hypothetical protein GCM10011571_34670 [Marinithermofilum abyssi]|uniref:Uncharacterized protein n=1 Tax=Marinithermofilum abyssi TaxID=1571185 RepID=A0A8J2YEV9_9BACL|nr:hypothetical protein GCM10011571_34670 [Marinithermofilum abyssi]